MNEERLDELILELEGIKYFLEITASPIPEEELMQLLDATLKNWREFRLAIEKELE